MGLLGNTKKDKNKKYSDDLWNMNFKNNQADNALNLGQGSMYTGNPSFDAGLAIGRARSKKVASNKTKREMSRDVRKMKKDGMSKMTAKTVNSKLSTYTKSAKPKKAK